ncbi:MAG: FlgD immunoglobulin-like domain containing protein, partial [bacterium]
VIGGRDANGNVVASIEVAEAADIVTSVAIKNPLPPTDFKLSQNYPNPFNAGTKITFQISSDINSPVKLAIYNLHGQLIRILVDKKLGPGNYEVLWAGIDQNGVAVASGIYFYTLQQGVNKVSKKMTLIR